MASKPKPAATIAPRPNVAQAKPQGGGTSGSNLLAQYESALMGGVGRGTGGNPLGDFAQGAEAFWNSSANLRQYGDQLRSDSRAHERGMQGDQLRSQEAQTGMQTGAEIAVARMQAEAQKHSANTQAGAQRDVATTQAGAQRDVAGIQAGADNFSALQQLEGIRAQTAGRVQEAGIGAKAQVEVAGLQTAAQRYLGELDAGTQKYKANTDLMGNLAGLASSERIAKGQQAGETERTKLQLAGALAMNREDNYSARSGQFFDYMGKVAGSQWRAPDVNNIKYWG